MTERTPALDRLQVFVGGWQRSGDEGAKGAPAPLGGRFEVTWGPGDVWMTWHAEIRFSTGQTLYGRRQIAWDAVRGHYATSWIDSQSAHRPLPGRANHGVP